MLSAAISAIAPPAAFDVRDYGAIGDGATMNTIAIQTAINRCAQTGGGRVTIPPGTFLTGTLIMKSNVELHLAHGATLLGSTNTKHYPRQPRASYRALGTRRGASALIYAEGAKNIAITGSGTINGQGSHFKEFRPKIILFISCRNVRIDGLNLRNSAGWMQHYLDCDNVIIRGLDVYNHSNRNNDAVDIDGCRRVTISDCNFDTDDDGITLKSTGPAPTEHVTITNCTVSSHCNAIKAGTESTGGFRNITISNCVVTQSIDKEPIYGKPEGGSAIALEIVDGGILEAVTISNIVIEGARAPLFIRLGNRARKHTDKAPKPGVGILRNVTISNIIAHNAGLWTSSIMGIPGHLIENVSISNVQLFSKGGAEPGSYRKNVKEREDGYPDPIHWRRLPACGLYLRHIRGLSIDGIAIGVQNPDDRPPICAEDVHNFTITNSRTFGPVKKDAFLKAKNISAYDIEKPLNWQGDAVTITK